MNKGRLEAFSDGVFSIVMTLFVFEIKVPVLAAPFSDASLWQALAGIWPLLGIYVLTFAVLGSLWINHHFLFESLAKSIDRRVNLMNLVYLMFVILVPFTAALWGEYSSHQPAAILYGLNIFAVVALSRWMASYISRTPGLLNDGMAGRSIRQGQFRGQLALISYVIGIAVTFVRAEVAAIFYIFPVIFNIIPGSLTLAERIFRFKVD